MIEKKKVEVKKKLAADKTGFDKKLGKLPLETFKKWFDERYTGDAKAVHDKLNEVKKG